MTAIDWAAPCVAPALTKDVIRGSVKKGITEPFNHAPCVWYDDPSLHNWYGERMFPGWRICLSCGAEEEDER